MAEDQPPGDESLGHIGLGNYAPYLMNRVMGRYNEDMQAALRDQGLTTTKMRIMAVLSVTSDLTTNELSVYTVTEQSTTSRTLDSLERAGLVHRRPRAGDARASEIALTAAGRAEFERVWPLMRSFNEAMLDGIGAEERAAFVGTLRTILGNIRKHKF